MVNELLRPPAIRFSSTLAFDFKSRFFPATFSMAAMADVASQSRRRASIDNTPSTYSPAEFFTLALGPQRKYSSCLYPSAHTTLAEAEIHVLLETVKHADIRDGMSILELGCGWGSLSLYMARRFPNARITSVFNSDQQRQYIPQQAKQRGLGNLFRSRQPDGLHRASLRWRH